MAAEAICDVCGKRASMKVNRFGNWWKPGGWFQRTDEDGELIVCSRECFDVVNKFCDEVIAEWSGTSLDSSGNPMPPPAEFILASALKERLVAEMDADRPTRAKLVYNKTTKKIDKVGHGGLVLESFDPPEYSHEDKE